MQYGVLHGEMSLQSKSTPARLAAGHIVGRIRCPGRFRRRLMLILGILGTILLILGRRDVVSTIGVKKIYPSMLTKFGLQLELQATAVTLGTYIPASIVDVIAQYGNDFSNIRWDDEVRGGKTAFKRPKFHLLIPASQPTANLCKTLLSAAVLNYPPPTLVNYGGANETDSHEVHLIKNTFNFFSGKEAHDNDLVLIVEEGMCLLLWNVLY